MHQKITVAQLVQGRLDEMELTAMNAVRAARSMWQLEQSVYTHNQYAYASGLLAGIRQLKSRIPKSWRKTFVESQT